MEDKLAHLVYNSSVEIGAGLQEHIAAASDTDRGKQFADVE